MTNNEERLLDVVAFAGMGVYGIEKITNAKQLSEILKGAEIVAD